MKRIWYSDVYNIVPCILNPYLSFHIDSSDGVWQFCVFLQQLAVARWDEAKVAQGSARQPRSLSIIWHFGRADSHAWLCRVAVSLATSLLQLSFATSAAHEKMSEAKIDAAQLTTVLRQCVHASSTLKRLGCRIFGCFATALNFLWILERLCMLSSILAMPNFWHSRVVLLAWHETTRVPENSWVP